MLVSSGLVLLGLLGELHLLLSMTFALTAFLEDVLEFSKTHLSCVLQCIDFLLGLQIGQTYN